MEVMNNKKATRQTEAEILAIGSCPFAVRASFLRTRVLELDLGDGPFLASER